MIVLSSALVELSRCVIVPLGNRPPAFDLAGIDGREDLSGLNFDQHSFVGCRLNRLKWVLVLSFISDDSRVD